MFKKLIASFSFLFCFAVPVISQDSLGAVHDWKVTSKKISDGKYELQFSGTISGNWKVYAPGQVIQDVKMSELRFADSSVMLETKNGIWSEDPPKAYASPVFDNETVGVYEKQLAWKAVITIRGTVPARLQGSLFYTYGNDTEFYPFTETVFTTELEGGVAATARIKITAADYLKPVNPCGDDGTINKSILTIFFLGFLGGLIALLTPCVFPMIPVTVTFFTKRSTSRRAGIRNAVSYGLFIFLIYVLITLPFHVAGKAISPEIFNNISTNVWLNFAFFAIFVIFALSFFGLFEIGLPSGVANRMDSKSGLGNIGGIFFMAATLAIVSFSCTGPILGTLLVGVADQGAWPLTAGAAGFGIALGLPFALFAMFPHWLQSLPKSGGWMTDVKVVLGFVELALAVKFFSNADLVKQWGLLKRELFIGIWLLIAILIVAYLLRWFRFRGGMKKFSFTRIAFALLFIAVAVYLAPGVTNTKAANLKLISGFPPPMCYSIYKNPVNCKKGFEPLKDYETALAKARKENKPLLIDFTGWGCVNCRKMEESVWTDPTVDSLMHKEFVVVSLYVDERRNLPLTEQIEFTTSKGVKKQIVTVGDKWATVQTENFGATAQPQYIILNTGERVMTKPKYYISRGNKAKIFADWLICGLDAFRKTTGNKQ
ncbi:MAG TPA: thioredoxin family protein [Chitinophagaceae bacterium]|jgi:thiol:disulfide interchange protein DsbD|nr:thioredoxin family protein [Chitinophagaceae bacterium]